MLSQKNRITRKDFPAHTRQGFRVFSGLFSGSIYKNNEQTVRVSVVVSKKTAKRATERNYLKRVFYAAMRPYLDQFTGGALVVLYPKKESLQAPFLAITEEIKMSLQKAKVLK